MDSFLIYIKNKFNILVFEIAVIIASPCILFFYILPNITSVSRGNTIAFVNAFSALTSTSILAFVRKMFFGINTKKRGSL